MIAFDPVEDMIFVSEECDAMLVDANTDEPMDAMVEDADEEADDWLDTHPPTRPLIVIGIDGVWSMTFDCSKKYFMIRINCCRNLENEKWSVQECGTNWI